MLFFKKAKLIKFCFLFVVIFASINLIYNIRGNKKNIKHTSNHPTTNQSTTNKNESKQQDYIFIGGYARSGTTLMRAILDVHPHIKCGPETKIIPPFVSFVSNWKRKSKSLNKDLTNAGINVTIVDVAIANFVSFVMNNRGFSAKRLCAKDPDIILHMEYMHSILPKAKFIYMVRDGRAAAYSLMVQIKEKLNPNVFRSYLSTWTSFNRISSRICGDLGSKYCLIVKYEDLVLHPEKTLKKVIEFLGENWTDELLKHHEHIGNEIQVSKTEWSSHQIIKPINSESINQWMNKIQVAPSDISFSEPMLRYFKYEIDLNNISKVNNQADSLVIENNKLISKNKQLYEKIALNVSDHIVNLSKRNPILDKFKIDTNYLHSN